MDKPLAAFVLAGGRSTRMGQDKSLLSLAGRPLIEHAISKLRHLTPDVFILGDRTELASFAPLVPDLRESCGPLGGMEAALTHAPHEWTLILPVDMPFLPTALVQRWVHGVLRQEKARLALFIVDEVPQPTVCLLHREMLPFLSTAARQGRYKLYPVLEEAARSLAHRYGVPLENILLRHIWRQEAALSLFEELGEGKKEGALTPAQRSAFHLWFENLNTPEQFAEAQLHLEALDTA